MNWLIIEVNVDQGHAEGEDVEELMDDLIRSIDRIRKSPAKLRGCILQSELPLFLR